MIGEPWPRTHPYIFLSYSREDSKLARQLENALKARGLRVWRDERSITAGQDWSDAIEKGIREAHGAVVLVTSSSTDSEWVIYEYAFARSAKIPVVAVVAQKARIPGPVRRFQIVSYKAARSAALKIDEGIQEQARSAGMRRASIPTLMAKFQEEDGKICPVKKKQKKPAFWMDLWVEQAPPETKSVAFEILDLNFDDRKWTVRRPERTANSPRQFLTDDMNSYGDVEIWARGSGRGIGSWLTKSTLYEALVRHHGNRPTNPGIRRGLKQIRLN